MVHPLCGYSLQKATKAIAIIDLVLCCVAILARGIAYEYMYKEYEYDYEDTLTGLPDANDTATEEEPKTFAFNFIPVNGTLEANLTRLLSSEEVKFYQNNSSSHYLWVLISVAVIGVGLLLGYIFLEVWLCRLLLRASKNRDGSACKTWFWIRLAITLIIVLASISSMATLKHDVVDWVLEPFNIYRLYALFIVNEFRKEISATACRLKMRA